MRFHGQTYKFLLFIIVLAGNFLLPGCREDNREPALFTALEADRTGLEFSNRLNATPEFNLFRYMYFYNGAGVGAGDFNNDGLVDIFFSSNQGRNSMYLNKGDLQFRDVTSQAGIPDDQAWNTGVSVVDINNDGLLDIYICRVSNYEPLKGHNLLLICKSIDEDGVPRYEEKSSEFGLDFSGLSTQAAFFDYDQDGDLDMFLLNHAVHQNGTFRPREEFVGTMHPLSGDRLFRNDIATAGNTGKKFTDVTKESGINSTAIGYGLGIGVADINLDGYPDLYIGNDFHENDYLYINQRNGTFKEESGKQMMHTSQFSMGVDVADINNDGYPEIISMDMLPSDPYILKRSLGEDAYDIFHEKLKNGYNYQYTRNNLQWNRRDSTFSEIGLYAGIYATDWSWSALWMDFDNDGYKDLFVSNGIPKRMNDIDYINYISNGEIQKKIRDDKMNETDMALIDKFPQIKIPNRFFRNKGDLSFADIADKIGHNPSTFSNGAAYADFDNDGDMDVVVSNINEPALLYKNETNDKNTTPYTRVKLKGPGNNVNAVGAKVVLFANGEVRLYEKHPVHGFQSSSEAPLHIGLVNARVDSGFVVWPDNTYTVLEWKPGTTGELTYTYQENLPQFNYSRITSFYKNEISVMEDITGAVGLQYRHAENHFVEFDREPLVPHMVSTEGPALAVGDVNKDGLDDVFIGSAKREQNALFLQQSSGKFIKAALPALIADSMFEDVDACFVDVNKDGNTDLVVASGGNEYFGRDQHMLPRVYLNDGAANFTKLSDAFADVYTTAACVVHYDFNKDGAEDLFIGGRAEPWAYGQSPRSFLLQNDGTGHFRDVTKQRAPELAFAGLVTQATWFDLDKDGDKDLVLSLEWGGIAAFVNEQGSFVKKMLTTKKGWWNFVLPYDFDNDGDIDLLAGNLGMNSRIKGSPKEPVRLYYNDFDNNGKKEQVVTYYLQGREVPFANKAELEKQMPVLRKRFQYAEDFAKVQLNDLLTSEKLGEADVLTADYFYSCLLINEDSLRFRVEPLPWQAQLTPYRDAVIVQANNDNLPDVLLAGNFYANNMEMGRNDEDYGTVLVNKGNGIFACESVRGMHLRGQTRKIRNIKIGVQNALVLARNNDSVLVVRFRQ